MPRTSNELEHGTVSQTRRTSSRAKLSRAAADLLDGIYRAPLWLAMGSQEIRQRYRRSRVGAFWITLSMAVSIAALGFLYGTLFRQPLDVFLPYLAAGFVVWGLMSGLINDGANAFIQSEGLIKQLAAPLSVYVYREVWGNLLIFGHNLLVYLVVLVVFQKVPGWHFFLAVPGVLIILLNGVWAGIVFGLLSARFRDIPQIIASVVQVLFFVTPIIWIPEMLPGRALVLDANPFYHFVEIVRAPMLGSVPSSDSWIFVGVVTVFGWVCALGTYTIYRWRIAYWV